MKQWCNRLWWLLHIGNTDKGLGKSLQETLLVLRNPR